MPRKTRSGVRNARKRPKARIRIAARAKLPTRFGPFEIIGIEGRNDQESAVALVHGRIRGRTPLVRVHSQCLTGDVFTSERCDCRAQLEFSLRKIARDVGKKLNLKLQEGVYLALSGPTYETPAEIRAFRTLGADAVGMSTVPEVIAMSHMNIPVLGISCITNMAAGVLKQKLHHQEVMDTAKRVEKDFTALVVGILERLAD